MRGRKPIPHGLKVVTGTNRGSTEQPEAPAVQSLRPPTGISKNARKAWRKLAPMLQRAGLLFTPDELALRMLCESFATWVEASDLAREQGLTVMAGNKTLVPNPNLAIASRAHEQLVKLLVEFGMTPSARTRIGTIGGGSKPIDTPTEKPSRFFG